VAVIGTGASAIQIVPRIQPRVDRLYVLQRTPPWVLPHSDREVEQPLRKAYRRFPPLQRLARYGVYWLREVLGAGFAGFKPVLWLSELIGRIHIRTQVKDRAMRRQVTPGYRIGCKRILLSDDWYPALQEPNAELVTERLTEVRGRSLVLADGSEREVDTIVFGTGFSPLNPPIAQRLRGADGRTLAETWADGMSAYLGTTVTGFPNLFMLWGPNTNLAHSSVVFMIECQLHYVMEALRAARARRADRVEVRPEAQQRWNDEVQEALRGSVWNTGGCASWYLDEKGNNPIMWPHQTFTFRQRLREFQPADYALSAASEPAPVTA
jgi:cation diffusion facilitator CzcD-associated flavoprotein CzcO